MQCDKARELLSATIDGEADAPPDPEVAGHLRTCRSCRAYLERARAIDVLTYGARSIGAGPGVTARVLDAARREPHAPDRWTSALRLGLLAVAIMQLGMALPGLLFGTDEGAPIHIAHEVGSWDLALAVGFLFAAWRPLRAIGLLPFAAALSAALILTAALDVTHGRAVALTESTHLLELVGTGLLYFLAMPRSRPQVSLRLQ